MTDIKNHYSQQRPDQIKPIKKNSQQEITVQNDKQTCIQKVQRKFEYCTDVLANYFQCSRVFSTQKLQQLRKRALESQKQSDSNNKSNKSQLSEQSQKYSEIEKKQDFKTYTKKEKDLLLQDYNQLPVHNYSTNQLLRFTKRYNQIYQKSYSQRKHKFGYTFEQVQFDRQRQYLKKQKNCWEQLKRLICCRGGNYLQELQQVQTDACSQLKSLKSSGKRQPSLLNSHKSNKLENNIFLFDEQNSPKQIPEQDSKINKFGRKVNKNLKLITNQQKSSRKSQTIQNNSIEVNEQKQIRKNYSRLGVDTQVLVKRKQYEQKSQGEYQYKQNHHQHKFSQPQLPHNKGNFFSGSQQYIEGKNNKNQNQISDERAQQIKTNSLSNSLKSSQDTLQMKPNINNNTMSADTFNLKTKQNKIRNPYQNINNHNSVGNIQNKNSFQNTNDDFQQYQNLNDSRQQQGVPKSKVDKKAKMSKMLKQIQDQNDQQFNSSQVVFFSDDLKNNNMGQLGQNNYQRMKKTKLKGKAKFKINQSPQQDPTFDILDQKQQINANQTISNQHQIKKTEGHNKIDSYRNKSDKLIIRQNQNENLGYTLDQIPNIEQPQRVGPQTTAFKKKRKDKKKLKPQFQQHEQIEDQGIIFDQVDQNHYATAQISKISIHSFINAGQNSEISDLKQPQQMFKKKKNKRKNLVVRQDDGQQVFDLENI